MSSGAPKAFHPERVAYYEAAGWRAYYDHRWLRAFWLMVRLNREQFRMPLPSALAAAVDIVRASIAFVPVDNDVPKAARYVRRYYEKARRSAGFQAEAVGVAELEMKYWLVHRQMAVERIKQPDLDNTAPMVEALADLHTALFDVSLRLPARPPSCGLWQPRRWIASPGATRPTWLATGAWWRPTCNRPIRQFLKPDLIQEPQLTPVRKTKGPAAVSAWAPGPFSP